jgi:hypothetical protein
VMPALSTGSAQTGPFLAPIGILRILTDRLERSNGAVVDHRYSRSLLTKIAQ